MINTINFTVAYDEPYEFDVSSGFAILYYDDYNDRSILEAQYLNEYIKVSIRANSLPLEIYNIYIDSDYIEDFVCKMTLCKQGGSCIVKYNANKITIARNGQICIDDQCMTPSRIEYPIKIYVSVIPYLQPTNLVYSFTLYTYEHYDIMTLAMSDIMAILPAFMMFSIVSPLISMIKAFKPIRREKPRE